MNVSDIIIILLILVIICFCYYNKNEKMENTKNNKIYGDGTYRDQNTCGLDKTMSSKKWYHYTNRLTNNNKIYETGSDNIKKKLTFHDKYNGEQCNKQPNIIKPVEYNDNSFKESDNFVHKYIKENVLDGKLECECIDDKTQSKSTRQEINDYYDNFIEFRDKIYASSDPAIDVVDKMNIITMNEGIHSNEQTIADVYDKLVG